MKTPLEILDEEASKPEPRLADSWYSAESVLRAMERYADQQTGLGPDFEKIAVYVSSYAEMDAVFTLLGSDLRTGRGPGGTGTLAVELLPYPASHGLAEDFLKRGYQIIQYHQLLSEPYEVLRRLAIQTPNNENPLPSV